MESLWSELIMPRFTPLEGNIKTDVLVIGGGIAGLLCAYQLQNAGLTAVVAEARQICGGVTANTTAKSNANTSIHFFFFIPHLIS